MKLTNPRKTPQVCACSPENCRRGTDARDCAGDGVNVPSRDVLCSWSPSKIILKSRRLLVVGSSPRAKPLWAYRLPVGPYLTRDSHHVHLYSDDEP